MHLCEASDWRLQKNVIPLGHPVADINNAKQTHQRALFAQSSIKGRNQNKD